MRTQDTGDRFLQALLNRDFDAMGAYLHPRVRLRALQPGGAIVRVGANPVVARWAEWFGGWDGLTANLGGVGPPTTFSGPSIRIDASPTTHTYCLTARSAKADVPTSRREHPI